MADVLERLRQALAERYRIEQELGRGGMATVYRAHDLKHGRDVAIKVMHPEIASSVGAERFLQEIRTAARLVHPHVLALFDSGEADGLLYYTMPYVAGESLADRLARDGRLSVEEALRIAREVATALAYAHEEGIVHRDVKPANILLVNGAHACVADFGLAHALSTASSHRLTATGLTLGSPLYMAPEQIEGRKEVDGRADVYSLGCVLFEMLAGRPPFEGGSIGTVLTKHLATEPPPVRAVRPEVPEGVEALIAGALAKEPGRRGTAREMAASLTLVSHSPREAPSRVGRMAAWGDPLPRSAAAGAVLLALALLGTLAVDHWRGPDAVPAVNVVILPIDAPAATGEQGSEDRLVVQRFLANAVETIPGIRALDGSGITDGSDWRSYPLSDLTQRARSLGGRYLLAGDMISGSTPRITVDLYSLATGERLLQAAGGASDESIEHALGRIGLEAARLMAVREKLAMGEPDYVIASARSPAALAQFRLGHRSFREGDMDAAAASYRRAIAADSSFVLAYYRLSVTETWEPHLDFPAALRAVEAGLDQRARLSPQWIRLLEAQRHYVRRDGAEAIRAFQRVVAENPPIADGWLGLGESLFHYRGYQGGGPQDALPAFERAIALDSTIAPIYHHLADLAIRAGDAERATRYTSLIEDPGAERIRRIALALRFGGSDAYENAIRSLGQESRHTISILAQLFAHRPALLDTLGMSLQGVNRTPDDELRGAQYRLAGLTGQGRWREGLSNWRETAVPGSFDKWVLHAYFAGFPLRETAEPMLRSARALLESGQIPTFTSPQYEVRDPFRALVHDALSSGDSALVADLLNRLEAAAEHADPSDPEPEGLRFSLYARRALLAADTLQAIGHLERSLQRAPWWPSAFAPLTDAAPQRLLLAQLLLSRSEAERADRWLRSFGALAVVGDAIYSQPVARLRASMDLR